MRAVVVAAMALVGCGSNPRDCSLAAVYEAYVGSAAVDDCGNLYDDGVTGTDMAAWQAAQACALDRAGQQHPLLVRWTVQGIEGPISGAYVGVSRDGQWTLAAFDQSAAITGVLPPTTRYACSELQVAPSPCNSLTTNLCIDCVGRSRVEQCMP